MRTLVVPGDNCLRVHDLGIVFPSPLGLAGGFDKRASIFDAYLSLGSESRGDPPWLDEPLPVDVDWF